MVSQKKILKNSSMAFGRANTSKGMFLYARLIIDYLSKQLFLTAQELNEALQELPPELEGL